MKVYDRILHRYDAYVDTFRDGAGKLPEMMQLKREHTAFVVRNAELIADGESFDARQRELARIAALLHDTGRYEQLRRYNTFKDSDSVDHAVFSRDIVVREGWLDQEPVDADFSPRRERPESILLDAEGKEAVLKAVLYHNRRELPEGMSSPLDLAAHTVRDADKLDIFRVLEDRLKNPAWRSDTRAFWNLKIEAAPNPEVVRAIEAFRPVPYNDILTLADFVLIQVGWMISGLFFATSRRLCRERGHLAFRRAFLHTLTDDPAVDRLCDLAETVGADSRSRE